MPPRRSTTSPALKRTPSGSSGARQGRISFMNGGKVTKPAATASKTKKRAATTGSTKVKDIDVEDAPSQTATPPPSSPIEEVEKELEAVKEKKRESKKKEEVEEETHPNPKDRVYAQLAKEIDAQRIHPQIHAQHLTSIDKILRNFDLTYKYGPCVGLTRLQRWERAEKMGLEPPSEVRRILMTVEGREEEGLRQGYQVETKRKNGRLERIIQHACVFNKLINAQHNPVRALQIEAEIARHKIRHLEFVIERRSNGKPKPVVYVEAVAVEDLHADGCAVEDEDELANVMRVGKEEEQEMYDVDPELQADMDDVFCRFSTGSDESDSDDEEEHYSCMERDSPPNEDFMSTLVSGYTSLTAHPNTNIEFARMSGAFPSEPLTAREGEQADIYVDAEECNKNITLYVDPEERDINHLSVFEEPSPFHPVDDLIMSPTSLISPVSSCTTMIGDICLCDDCAIEAYLSAGSSSTEYEPDSSEHDMAFSSSSERESAIHGHEFKPAGWYDLFGLQVPWMGEYEPLPRVQEDVGVCIGPFVLLERAAGISIVRSEH
ncbi:hypothetical protein YB2330_003663 [Saitoella coloradoensis]